MSKNILIIGGGTGGHISPGIALYEKLGEDGNMSPLFLTGKNDLRFGSFTDIDKGKLFTYNAPALTRNPFKIPMFLLKFTGSVLKTIRVIKKNNVSAVVGMGGYVSAPALVAAKFLKVPIFLCEQNTVPGKVTLKFEKHCENIFGTFPDSLSYLKMPGKYIHCGNPIRNNVLVQTPKNEAKKAFHLDHCGQVILIIGGSQGAVKLNDLVLGLKKAYPHEFKNIGIIWSTGDYSFDEYKNKSQNEVEAGSIYISPYIKRVGKAYRACDISISRSGAGVMMELAAAGIPSILIPYPHAAMDHQSKNADSFAAAGAAVKINDEDAVAEKVAPVLFDLLNHPRKLKVMSECAKKAAKVDAADVIVKNIKEILELRGK
ncbi:MAG TPA: UDP-N-acetylglucosamine--N-acetylmuramyl-(pentapeptide) pyrophosphoryl-undecaprenol N-acetylglucosamine transferase [Spirochaetota bacterium]|nr:UDP-N-acetylglucosamine--N-acetylmuramyl-(pentapeptide) pyrophosphoryl-undecaprenol N-acetylglucosamine transferase [Spirochaetota bacterium]HPS87568.1 UDP-N-acetylglucosamine--N-acetylmuramyl-(pentapeptide) pyrophosphoryl-undecaprenol N-acetylglucosamine transferase [Spirochaetota bacterium]